MGSSVKSIVGGGLVGGSLGASFGGLLGLGSGPDPISIAGGFQPTGFSGGGLTATPEGNMMNISSGLGRSKLIKEIQALLGGQAQQIKGQLGEITPGFGRLTEAGLAAVANARESFSRNRRRIIGDLRSNLQRRRVEGSSFAQDALAGAESEMELRSREIDQMEKQVRAESFLKEFAMKQDLMQRQFEKESQSLQVALGNMNFEATLGAQLSGGMMGAMQQSNALQAQLAMMNLQGQGQLLGQLINLGGTAGLLAAFSDRRMKENIVKIGEYEDGISIYEFDYVDGEASIGFMADEIEIKYPQIVTEVFGYKRINGRIGVRHG